MAGLRTHVDTASVMCRLPGRQAGSFAMQGYYYTLQYWARKYFSVCGVIILAMLYYSDLHTSFLPSCCSGWTKASHLVDQTIVAVTHFYELSGARIIFSTITALQPTKILFSA